MAVASLDVNENVAVRMFVGSLGVAVIVTVGGLVSTIQVRVAGDGSTRPTGSLARTANVCEPPARVKACGEVHAVDAAAASLHSKVAVGSGERNSKVTLAPVIEPTAGPEVISVSGAVVSTVQVVVAGLASMLPAASMARTWQR